MNNDLDRWQNSNGRPRIYRLLAPGSVLLICSVTLMDLPDDPTAEDLETVIENCALPQGDGPLGLIENGPDLTVGQGTIIERR